MISSEPRPPGRARDEPPRDARCAGRGHAAVAARQRRSPDLRLPRRWIETVLPAELPQIAREISRRVPAEIPEYRWAADAEQRARSARAPRRPLLHLRHADLPHRRADRRDRGLLPRPGPARGDRGHARSRRCSRRSGWARSIAWRRIAAAAERDPLPSEIVGAARRPGVQLRRPPRAAGRRGLRRGARRGSRRHARLRARLARMIARPADAVDRLDRRARGARRLAGARARRRDRARRSARRRRTLGRRSARTPSSTHERRTPLVVLPAPVDLDALHGGARTRRRASRGRRLHRRAGRRGEVAALGPAGRAAASTTACCPDPARRLRRPRADPAAARRAASSATCSSSAASPRWPRCRSRAGSSSRGCSPPGSSTAAARPTSRTPCRRTGRPSTTGSAGCRRCSVTSSTTVDARVELLLALRWALPRWEREAG